MSDETKTTETTPVHPAAEKKPRGPGVGAFCKDLIRAGKSNQEVLDAVKAKFPEAKTTLASINWYRNDLRSKEPGTIPSARAIRAEAKAAEKAAKAAEKAAPTEATLDGALS